MPKSHAWSGRAAAGLAAWLTIVSAATLAGWGLPAPAGAAGGAWTTYHFDPGRSGNDTAEPALTPATQAWSSLALDGAVYAQPLAYGGRVYVATENDTVYALDPSSGTVLWSRHVGVPVPLSSLPCGDIDPLGITGTPVIDPATGTLFAVAEQRTAQGGVQHVLVGLDITSGGDRFPAVAVDPAGMTSPKNQQQRAALALAGGRVQIAFGGLDGDCPPYNGWVVSVPESGDAAGLAAWRTRGSLGGIWAPSGPAVDPNGNVYVSTGNGSSVPGQPYDDGDSVVKLSPSGTLLDEFAPSTWAQDNQADRDLGSTGPELLDGGLLFAVGKNPTGYLVAENAMGPAPTTPPAFSGPACTSAAFGGDAYANGIIYVPCTDGTVALKLTTSPPSFTKLWKAAVSANGPPIVAGGAVWVVDWHAAVLYALDPASGAQQAHFSLGTTEHFTSPSAGDGLVLVGAGNRVLAFSGPAGPPPPASSQGYWTAASDGGVFSFGRAPFFGSTGSLRLNRPIVGLAATGDRAGYWLDASDGGIFAFGDAGFYGSTGAMHINAPIVGMTATPSGHGYWLVASDGGIFAFGDAAFYGSTGAIHLNRPVVGMTSSSTGRGYRLVASDGGLFAFGDAAFYGSAGAIPLAQPIVGMASTVSGLGYRLVASDGGIFAFGDADYLGSTGGTHINRPMVAIATAA